MTQIDEAVAIRDGEELDVARVDQFMKEAIPGLEGEPSIRQYPGGASNLTYQIDYGERSFVLRRPPFGHIAKSAHDMLREARVMKALKPVFPYVPEIIAICDDHDVLGCDFYVMERMRGIILRQDFPEGFHLSEGDTRKLCLNVIDKLVDLHRVDVQAAGLGHLGKGPGYVQRQIGGWSNRFRKARTDDVGDFEPVMAWLNDKMPEDITQCLIHNDFRFDNVVLNPDNPFEVTGVLDWEMATIGDPLMDLGNSLAYWIQADDEQPFQILRRQPTHQPGMLTRDEVVEYYMERSGYHADRFDFYEIYGLFRLAAIIQQIYYRFYHGQTTDKRFAMFGQAANYLQKRCLRLIGESDL
ncbi:aminoglycoside phosphotransferase (APT) family kinase protein [Tamilnaduibacter salinus]|uniref:Aminoglycoside phosphotransferase (APT) family kinase protein n=1 Tax=Tamilnaduibacter salinus TaxID=1484056 RepID=A0A2A2I7Q1_9GAMM|nr:phosphotransferase family protein [Tamilnaduibacter salinus]PAV27150.1 phosphotransferase family protein [Tamilnaduibacter salinus]PVY79021.1 aminoglycoside phosphotransferase (APT) family kinase protein [Tamilnaduibacter salinus]